MHAFLLYSQVTQKNFMYKTFQMISISLLLVAMESAWAGPGDRDGWRDGRGRYSERQPRAADRQGFQPRRENQMQRQFEPLRGDRGFQPGGRAAPVVVAPGPQGLGPFDATSEGSRRPGRMTLEERRALRRQIDQAGRDIYRPGRPSMSGQYGRPHDNPDGRWPLFIR